jgi:hypothetical protein
MVNPVQDLRHMLEMRLRNEEEENQEFVDMIDEERAHDEMSRLERDHGNEEQKRVNESHQRNKSRVASLCFDRRSDEQSGHCTDSAQEEIQEQEVVVPGFPALMPEEERLWREEQSGQVVDEEERPVWLRFQIVEAMMEELTNTIGKWADTEIILDRLQRSGWERWQCEELIR